LQASAAAPASGLPLEFPATPLPDEKIHQFHLVRNGLVLVSCRHAFSGYNPASNFRQVIDNRVKKQQDRRSDDWLPNLPRQK
jgi:hypothetical protein